MVRRAVTWLLLAVFLVGCGSASTPVPTTVSPPKPNVPTLRIIAGSHVRSIKDVIDRFPKKSQIQITELGATDIKNKLARGETDFNVVWAGSELWTQLVPNNPIRNEKSIMRSPVGFAIKQSKAQQLGWVGRRDITWSAIIDAVTQNNIPYAAASGTQSDCGAMWLFGGMTALSGDPYVITEAHLQNPALQESLRELNDRVAETSANCVDLADKFLGNYAALDAMVNNEVEVIRTNQELTRQGKEPLYMVYPQGKTPITSAYLGFVGNSASAEFKLFQEFQDYLTSAKDPQQTVVREIEAKGWRTYLLGMQVSPEQRDKLITVFNPSWGIDPDGKFEPYTFPNADVASQALNLYQTALKKADLFIFLFDYSGSMNSAGVSGKPRIDELKKSATDLFTAEKAREYYLEFGPDSIVVVIPFSGTSNQYARWVVSPTQNQGNFGWLAEQVNKHRDGGGTDIYTPIVRALEIMKENDDGSRRRAIIVMTDGKNESRTSIDTVKSAIGDKKLNGYTAPIHTVRYGDANEKELREIADLTGGGFCDGTKRGASADDTSMLDCLRKAIAGS